MRDDPLDLVVTLAWSAPHVTGAGDNPDVLRAAVFQQQIDIRHRMLIVFLSINAKQRRARLINKSLRHQRQSWRNF